MQGNDIRKNNIKYNRFSKIAIVIMVIVFITNFLCPIVICFGCSYLAEVR